MRRVHTLVLAAFVGSFGGTALAQTAVQPSAPNMPSPQSTIPEKIAPDTSGEPSATGATGTGATLSDKLEATGGVIKPPAGISPDMTVPAPNPEPGTTPVIPAPGSPGGNPTLNPK